MLVVSRTYLWSWDCPETLNTGFYFLKRRHFLLLKIQTLLYFGISIHWVFVSLQSPGEEERQNNCLLNGKKMALKKIIDSYIIHLKNQSLPVYMWPSSVSPLLTIPTTHSQQHCLTSIWDLRCPILYHSCYRGAYNTLLIVDRTCEIGIANNARQFIVRGQNKSWILERNTTVVIRGKKFT